MGSKSTLNLTIIEILLYIFLHEEVSDCTGCAGGSLRCLDCPEGLLFNLRVARPSSGVRGTVRPILSVHHNEECAKPERLPSKLKGVTGGHPASP